MTLKGKCIRLLASGKRRGSFGSLPFSRIFLFSLWVLENRKEAPVEKIVNDPKKFAIAWTVVMMPLAIFGDKIGFAILRGLGIL